jgi:antitoxin component of MazEF toxin-antitoxin module
MIHQIETITTKLCICLVKGDHVYTLNYDLKALQQKQDDDVKVVVKANSNYHINENKKFHDYIMIESIDEYTEKFSKQIESKAEQTVINLIYKSDNLSVVVYELKESGYDPRN